MKRAAALMLIGVSAVACAMAIALDPTVIEVERPRRRPVRYVVDLDWAGRPKGGDA